MNREKCFEIFKMAVKLKYGLYFPNKWEGDTQLFIELTLIQQYLRNTYQKVLVSLPYTTYPEMKSMYIWMLVGNKSSTAEKNIFTTYEEALVDGLLQTVKTIIKQ